MGAGGVPRSTCAQWQGTLSAVFGCRAISGPTRARNQCWRFHFTTLFQISSSFSWNPCWDVPLCKRLHLGISTSFSRVDMKNPFGVYRSQIPCCCCMLYMQQRDDTLMCPTFSVAFLIFVFWWISLHQSWDLWWNATKFLQPTVFSIILTSRQQIFRLQSEPSALCVWGC